MTDKEKDDRAVAVFIVALYVLAPFVLFAASAMSPAKQPEPERISAHVENAE